MVTPKSNKNKTQRVADIAKMAREAGLSYGEYVSRLYSGQEIPENKKEADSDELQ